MQLRRAYLAMVTTINPGYCSPAIASCLGVKPPR
jgi:hypothetical protein